MGAIGAAAKRRRLWAIVGTIAAVLSAGGVPGGSDAGAATLTTIGTSSTAEAAWTNCPPAASFDGQPCNYTAVFTAVGDRFQPFMILQMVNLALYMNGTTQVTAAAAGHVQPANMAVDGSTIAAAFASGDVDLYGNCGDPNNLATCAYFGVGHLSASWDSPGTLLSWNETKNIAEGGNTYVYSTSGRTIPAAAFGSASFQGGPWDLGALVSARISNFNIGETLTCPGACAAVAQGAPTAEALASRKPGAKKSAARAADARRNPPLRGLKNATPRGKGLTGNQAKAAVFDPFDFSPLGQVNSMFYATGFYGGSALSGLGQFVDGLLASYASSGRSFGFFPQAFNNDAYFNASSFNSSGIFFTFNDPFGG